MNKHSSPPTSAPTDTPDGTATSIHTAAVETAQGNALALPHARYRQNGMVHVVGDDPTALPSSDGAKVKMDLTKRPVDGLASFVANHLTMMTDNPAFPMPTPTQPELLDVYTAFKDSAAETEAAYTTYLIALSKRNENRTALETAMRRRGAYVQAASNGNRQAIVSSGLEVGSLPAPVGMLPAPPALKTELSSTAGVIRLTWPRVRKARGYLVQSSPDVTPRQWELEGCPTKPHFEKQFTVGDTLVFRVATQGTQGLSYWSPEVIRGAA
jgi:hypothetical protein